MISPARVTITLQIPADDDVNDVPLEIEQPAVPMSDMPNEYPPEPEPPDPVREMLVLKVPLIDVNDTTSCVAFPIVTVVAPELAIT